MCAYIILVVLQSTSETEVLFIGEFFVTFGQVLWAPSDVCIEPSYTLHYCYSFHIGRLFNNLVLPAEQSHQGVASGSVTV